MEFYTKEVTPFMAAKLLENNQVNRKRSEGHIKFLAKQMSAGNFKLTGETVKISTDGKLLDGQHRLHAIVLANMTVTLSFCEGLDASTFDVMDTGKSRTASDIMSIQGYKNALDLSASVRYLIFFKSGRASIKDKNLRPSNSEVLKFIESNSQLSEMVNLICAENKKFRAIPASAMAALYFVFRQLHQTSAEYFLDKYYTGLDMEESDPIYLLRKALIADMGTKKKMSIIEKCALVVVAWNVYRAKKQVKRLSIPTDSFPKAI